MRKYRLFGSEYGKSLSLVKGSLGRRTPSSAVTKGFLKMSAERKFLAMSGIVEFVAQEIVAVVKTRLARGEPRAQYLKGSPLAR